MLTGLVLLMGLMLPERTAGRIGHPTGRRDGCPNSHPISPLDPRIHRTQPRQNRCRGAMNARIHRTGSLIMEKLGLARMATW